jgi:large subunit ribosomal protein L13
MEKIILQEQGTYVKQAQIARNITLNATGKVLGRFATEIAFALQGKDMPDFRPNKDAHVTVNVENVKALHVTGKKMGDKKYWHFSGYPGGISSRTLEELWEENPGQVLYRAVRGMLPKNSLRQKRLNRLIIN